MTKNNTNKEMSPKAASLALMLYENFLELYEQQQQQQPAQVAPPIPSPVPTATQPQGAPPSGQDVIQQPAQTTAEQLPEISLEMLIDKLNIIRGGKSFSDPVLAGKLNQAFNQLSDTEKAGADKVLGVFAQVIQEDSQQSGGQQQQQQATTTTQDTLNPTAPSSGQAQTQQAAPMTAATSPGGAV